MHVGKALAQLPHTTAPLMCFYGVGDHGGGPTRDNIDSIHELQERDQFPRLQLSTVRAFFDAARKDPSLPCYSGEIQPHAVGCYSAHSGIKTWLRQCEHALQAAEKWAAVATMHSGLPDASGEIERAWRQVLLNQFHDTAAGTAPPSAYEDARDQLGEAKAIAARVQNRSLQSISRRVAVAAEERMTPIVVFNPHPWPVRATVEIEFGRALGDGPLVAEDDEGYLDDVQVVRSSTVTGGRRRLLVPVELPPLGYRLYRLRPAPADRAAAAPSAAAVPDGPDGPDGPIVLENAHLRAVVDPFTGWLSSLRAAGGAELAPFGPPAGRHAIVLDDHTDTWGHDVVSYRSVIGAFRPVSVRRTERGPVRTSVRVTSRYGGSTLVEELILDRDARHLEVRVTLDWHERLTMLKLRFPTRLIAATATHEIPYGHVVRTADGHEAPSQAWVDVSGEVDGEPAGLSVLDDAKCGADVAGADIGMTAVRSPAYAWHEPEPLPADGDYEVMDQGVQRFGYRLLPHAGDWRAAGTVRAAAELNQRPVPVIESEHDGPLPARACFAAVSGADNVVLSVLKPAADGSARVVVRGYETAGRPARATLELPLLGRKFEVEFGPAQILTLLVPRAADQPVEVTDFLEGLTSPPTPLGWRRCPHPAGQSQGDDLKGTERHVYRPAGEGERGQRRDLVVRTLQQVARGRPDEIERRRQSGAGASTE